MITNYQIDDGFEYQDRAEPVHIWRARSFIARNSDQKISLGAVAKAVNINPTYLSERFKEVTGQKFVDYVARFRCEKALGLLNDGDNRISEIAFAAGFQSLSQFNRVFKRSTGKTPKSYRSMLRKKKKSDAQTAAEFFRKND